MKKKSRNNLYVCAVTLYHPDNSVADRIYKYSEIFDTVYLFDNTEDGSKEISDAVIDLKNVDYIWEGENAGLPKAFNTILAKLPDNASVICLMDQDSDFAKNDIINMIDACEIAPLDAQVIGPKVIYDNSRFEKQKKFKLMRYVITSGSFINIEYMRDNKIKFDENYFIDRAEVDLDEQIKRSGGKIYQYEGAVLYQQLGERGKNNKTNHSPLRHYYIFRNRLYFNKKYYNGIIKWVRNILQIIRHVYEVVMFEENKKQKLNMMIRGYRDYKRNVFGKGD